MEKPTIEINGTIYTMKEPKARMWRTWTKFDSEKQELLTTDFIDKHAELLAGVFDGLTADDILDHVDLSEILRIYHDCFRYLTVLLTSKLETAGKNVPEDGEKERK